MEIQLWKFFVDLSYLHYGVSVSKQHRTFTRVFQPENE